MEHADVSVIVPAFNAAATIEDCLASIAAQTMLPREVIVIDDGSTDATAERVRAYIRNHDEFACVLLSQPNSGAGAARNAGLAQASAAYVAFLDSDDLWLPTKLAASLEALTPDLAMVSHDYISFDEDHRETLISCSRHMSEPGNPFEKLYLRGFVATSTVVVRRDLLARAGGFDAALRAAQDYDLWLRLAAAPEFRLRVLPEALTRYRKRRGSITSQAFRRLVCGVQIMRKLSPNVSRLARRPGRLMLAKASILLIEYLTNLRR